jgi:hypothetical protein
MKENLYYVYMNGFGRLFITSEDIEDNLGWLFTGALVDCKSYIAYQLHEEEL